VAEPAQGDRPCVDCGKPGLYPMVDVTGEHFGYICENCDRKRRNRQMGWRRRFKRRMRRFLGLSS
jgi:hypothetical protein